MNIQKLVKNYRERAKGSSLLQEVIKVETLIELLGKEKTIENEEAIISKMEQELKLDRSSFTINLRNIGIPYTGQFTYAIMLEHLEKIIKAF